MNTRKKTPLRYSNKAAPVPRDAPKAKPRPEKKKAVVKKAPPAKPPKPVATTRKPTLSARPTAPVDPNDWGKNYKALCQHKSTFGTCKITKDDMASYNVNLARWCTWQRIDRDTLVAEKVEKLNAIDFSWDVPIPDHFRFECMYAKLKRYHAQYGDCLVPVRWKQDPKFGKWVSRQRETHETLPKDRKAKLDGLGFTWKVRAHEKRRLKEEQRHEPVSRKYTEAVAYKKKLKEEHQKGHEPKHTEAKHERLWQNELDMVLAQVNVQSSTAKLPQYCRDWLSDQLWTETLSEEQTRKLVKVLGRISPNQTANCLWDHRLLHVSALLKAYGQEELGRSRQKWLDQQLDLLRHGGLTPRERQMLLACLKHNGLRHTVNGLVQISPNAKKEPVAMAPLETVSSSKLDETNKLVPNNGIPTTQGSADPPTEKAPATETTAAEALGALTPKLSNRKAPIEGSLSFGPPKLTSIRAKDKGLKPPLSKKAKKKSAAVVTPEATPRNGPAVVSSSSSVAKKTNKTKRPRPHNDEEARSFVAACSRKLKQLHRPTKRKRMLTF